MRQSLDPGAGQLLDQEFPGFRVLGAWLPQGANLCLPNALETQTELIANFAQGHHRGLILGLRPRSLQGEVALFQQHPAGARSANSPLVVSVFGVFRQICGLPGSLLGGGY